MRPAEQIKRLFKKSQVTAGPKVDDRILGDALGRLEKLKKAESASAEQNIWRIIMKNPITKLATAAVILVAILIGINQFGGSIDGASVAWADILEQIYSARSVTYKKTFEFEDHISTATCMLMEPSHGRSELDIGVTIISDGQASKSLQLTEHSKKALITHYIGKERKRRKFNRLVWLQKLYEEDDAEFTNQDVIDEQIANVFINEVPFEKTTVWVDPETNLPIKVKMEMFPNTDGNIVSPKLSLTEKDFGGQGGGSRVISIYSSRNSGLGINDKMTYTYHDFVWNAQLDESLFSMEPPEDYSIKEQQFDESEPDEESLIYALSFWTEMSEDIFPSDINNLGDPEKIKPLLIKKFNGDGDPEKELDLAMDDVNKILKGLYFAQEKKVDGTWGYVGQGVQLGDTEKIICWWFDEETEGYKAIFGDLSIEDVTEDQLPIQP